MADRPLRCRTCGKALPPPARTGRPRRYCDETCRYRFRGRELGIAEALVGVELGPEPDRDAIAAELAATFTAAAPSAPEDRLAGLLVELRSASSELGRIARDLPPSLSARAVRLAGTVDKAVARDFREVL